MRDLMPPSTSPGMPAWPKAIIRAHHFTKKSVVCCYLGTKSVMTWTQKKKWAPLRVTRRLLMNRVGCRPYECLRKYISFQGEKSPTHQRPRPSPALAGNEAYWWLSLCRGRRSYASASLLCGSRLSEANARWVQLPGSYWVCIFAVAISCMAMRLTWSSKNRSYDKAENLNEVVWGHLEDNFQHTKADVLEIFDWWVKTQ